MKFSWDYVAQKNTKTWFLGLVETSKAGQRYISGHKTKIWQG